MSEAWHDRAIRQLLSPPLRRGSGVWGYRARTIEAVEPSSLTSLALLASDGESKSVGRASAEASGTWLSSIRQSDGSLGVTPELPKPGWTTPFGLLLWSALGRFDAERAGAVAWLLADVGQTLVKSADDPMGHDSTIVGWPWVAGTHSWVEPTAISLLALAIEGKSEHPRVVEGVRLLADRAIPGSGWNLGNPVVFKTPLRPLPAPTGLALLALARLDASSKAAGPAITYLREALASTLAPVSLGWGLLGLRAWGADLPDADARLKSAFERLEGREVATADLALLLLAAGGDRSLRLFGIGSRTEGARHA